MYIRKPYFVEDKNTTTTTNGNEPVSIAAMVEMDTHPKIRKVLNIIFVGYPTIHHFAMLHYVPWVIWLKNFVIMNN